MFCNHCGAEVRPYVRECPKCGQTIVRAVQDDEPPDEEFLRTAIGPNRTDHYMRKFARFAAGGSYLSWNWPSFFVTTPWMIYRKMWAYAALNYFVLPLVFLLLALLVAVAQPDGVLAGLVWLLYLPTAFVVIPMFANALYYRTVRKRIAAAKAYSPNREQQLRALAGEGGTSGTAVVVIIALMFVPTIGILAGISIPAYQDYTIRAQVSEGLSLAAGARAAVSDAIARTGVVPADNDEAGVPVEISGKYVESVEVDFGRIDVTYGAAANSVIAGKTLSLTPYGADPQSGSAVLWRCGQADVPAAARAEIAVYRPSDIDPRHLPNSCRPQIYQGLVSSSSSSD